MIIILITIKLEYETIRYYPQLFNYGVIWRSHDQALFSQQ